MKYTEKKRMQQLISPDQRSLYGHIELLHLAKPESVKVLVQGEEWIPEKFNLYGEPLFSEEATLTYEEMEKELQDTFSDENFVLKAVVTYEEADFSVPRELYDSSDGLHHAIRSLESFTTLLNQRRMWRKIATTNDRLREFVVFGKYILDQFGGVLQIEQEPISCSAYPVCPKRFFDFHAGLYSLSATCLLPTHESVCPCCGKGFTMDDLQYTTLKLVDGKIAHESCG